MPQSKHQTAGHPGGTVADHRLSLAVNGRESQLHTRLVTFDAPGPAITTGSVAIVGLGYVGLPTAVELHGKSPRIIGIDVSELRLRDIASRQADLTDADQERLAAALADGSLELTTDPSAAAAAEAVIICVPTPVDGNQTPDLAALQGACAAVVQHAVPGQVIILTSTSYVGTTRELLTEPLRQRGLTAGTDISVAFSPERIDPGNPMHLQSETPRVVGGATGECTSRAAEVIGRVTDSVYLVSSTDAAEATKLYENIFRCVTRSRSPSPRRTCPGGWPASTRCSSSAGNWGCPPRRPRWPGHPGRRRSSPGRPGSRSSPS
jgi:3-hydroxyisobutyrate dehydrogenase-like beta-hydroxyacid dehydrogenase